MRIGQRIIGVSHPVYIIAEACDNHLGNLDTAKEMARQAKLAGCDAIKFQHHIPDEEMLKDVPTSENFSEPLYDFLIKYALTLDQHKEIKGFTEAIGIQYLCTPFSYRAARELFDLDVDAFKIGSGEMTDIPTLKRIATEFSLPMIISTGMSTFEEIDRTYVKLTETGVPIALLNCVSEYPPVYQDINLRVIGEMIRRFPDATIGHSDHTPDIYTSFAAVALGATIIEKHVILDKAQPGPDQSVSIDFHDMAQLVDGIRKIEFALGNTKKIHPKEVDIRKWALRSLVTLRPMKSGEIIREDDIWSKRPGTGIPSHRMAEVVGKRLIRDIPDNEMLHWVDLTDNNSKK